MPGWMPRVNGYSPGLAEPLLEPGADVVGVVEALDLDPGVGEPALVVGADRPGRCSGGGPRRARARPRRRRAAVGGSRRGLLGRTGRHRPPRIRQSWVADIERRVSAEADSGDARLECVAGGLAAERPPRVGHASAPRPAARRARGRSRRRRRRVGARAPRDSLRSASAIAATSSAATASPPSSLDHAARLGAGGEGQDRPPGRQVLEQLEVEELGALRRGEQQQRVGRALQGERRRAGQAARRRRSAPARRRFASARPPPRSAGRRRPARAARPPRVGSRPARASARTSGAGSRP